MNIQCRVIFFSIFVGSVAFAEKGAEDESPAAKESVKLAWEDKPDALSSDLTTVNEQRGSWYFKAQIFRKARKTYKDLRAALDKIQPIRSQLLKQRDEVDTQLDAFYRDYGFQLGELNRYLQVVLEKQAENEDDSFEEQLQLLEQLHEDFDHIQELDAVLRKSAGVIEEQWSKAATIEEKAFESYEKLEDVLNDKVAEDLYRTIENGLQNIQTILKYLNDTFTGFFKVTVESVNESTKKIKDELKDLQEKYDIALGKSMKEIQQEKEAARQKEQELAEQKKEVTKTSSPDSRGWFDSLFAWWKSFVQVLSSWIFYVWSFFS